MNTLKAQHVAHNDEHHDYNKSGFVCHVETRQDANIFGVAHEAIELVRAFAYILDELPHDAARPLKLQADTLLRRVDQAKGSR